MKQFKCKARVLEAGAELSGLKKGMIVDIVNLSKTAVYELTTGNDWHVLLDRRGLNHTAEDYAAKVRLIAGTLKGV